MKPTCILLSEKTFLDIITGKRKWVQHDLTPRYKKAIKKQCVIFISYYSGNRQLFKIIKYEITILNTVKIHVEKI